MIDAPTIEGSYESDTYIEVTSFHTMPKDCIIQMSFDGGETWSDQKSSIVYVPYGGDTIYCCRIISTKPLLIDKQAKQIKKLKAKLKKVTRQLAIEQRDNAELVSYGIDLLKENKKLKQQLL